MDKPAKSIKIWTITTTYVKEISKFISAIHKGEGVYCGCLVIDRYNYWGERNGEQYAIIYQAEEELAIEQWC